MTPTQELQNLLESHFRSDILERNPSTAWYLQPFELIGEIDKHSVSRKIGVRWDTFFRDMLFFHPTITCPMSIAGYGVDDIEAINYPSTKLPKNKQIILTRLDMGYLKKTILRKLGDLGDVKLNQMIAYDICQDILTSCPLQKNINQVNTDLCFLEGSVWYSLEIKSTGDIDTKKVIGEIAHSMMLPYICLGDSIKRTYYGVVASNREDRKGNWNGNMGRKIDKDMLLIEDELFQLINPWPSITFSDFQQAYTDHITSLIGSYS